MRRCAVIADAVSPDYHFPRWVEYYDRVVGKENIFIFTYEDISAFGDFGLGGVTYAGSEYNNILRLDLFNGVIEGVLKKYNSVIRVDVDEFLVPDLRKFVDLSDFIAKLDKPYVTALGVDVIEMPDDAEMVYEGMSLLSQRLIGVKSAAYSKTCVVRKPLKWHFGFHNADVLPHFDHLYLFHMKFSDCRRRLAWLNKMSENCDGDQAHKEHFRNAQAGLIRSREHFYDLNVSVDPDAFWETSYQRRMEIMTEKPHDGEYHFRNIDGVDSTLILIPPEFRQCF